MPNSRVRKPLIALGFTALEAEIYVRLLAESPVTGYRIAQSLRKPAPNVYKALESLEAKGAVMVEDGRGRLCRPVPPEELLAHLERRFQEDRRRAALVLKQAASPTRDGGVYQLRSADQVRERARAMLTQAQHVALIDAFPRPLADLADALATAAGRGVTTAAKAYTPLAIDNVHVVVAASGASTLARWPGSWLNLVVDGREYLLAFLDVDCERIHQAIWTASPYLAWAYHSALAAEIELDAIIARLEAGVAVPALLQELADIEQVRALDAPGYHDLVERLRSLDTASRPAAARGAPEKGR